jgi:S1-C subfamily serine protease
MINSVIVLFILLCVCAISGCYSTETQQAQIEERLITISQNSDLSDIARLVEPAIVAINGVGKDGESVGSGVCVASGGYLLTNSHVVNDCYAINVILSNKQKTTASIIYEDTVLDFAILKCETSLPYLQLADSDSLNVGNDVLAVGTPLSLSLTHTFTKGIVSALNRTLKVGSDYGSGFMQNLIQHDASLNPGNSGGPLLNTQGQVVGINTLKISGGEGIGFAIPTKSFISLLDSFVENINYQIPYLGVYGYDCEIANYYSQVDRDKGFYIIDISNESPLKSMGIQPSSVICAINGKEITNTLDLKEELYKLDASESVYIKYYYNGEYLTTKTKLCKTTF